MLLLSAPGQLIRNSEAKASVSPLLPAVPSHRQVRGPGRTEPEWATAPSSHSGLGLTQTPGQRGYHSLLIKLEFSRMLKTSIDCSEAQRTLRVRERFLF